MSDISSPKCFELYRRFGRVGSSLKTFADFLVSSLDGYSPRLSHCWKAKITRSSLFVFLLQPSARRTDATGSGLLPTQIAYGMRDLEGKLLRTPDANMERGPRTAQNLQERLDRGMPLNLNDQLDAISMGMLPTPKARDWKGGKGTDEERWGRDLDKKIESTDTLPTNGEQTGSKLRLEPAFVEWLMGLPLNWTSLEADPEPWPEMGTGGTVEMLATPTQDNWHGHRRQDFREGRVSTPSEAFANLRDRIAHGPAMPTMLLTPTASENEQDVEKFRARMEKYRNGTTMPNLATQIANIQLDQETTESQD